MGEVYKGHSIQTGDDVAIKVIRADLAENEIAIALFRNEASKLHRLHHEAIIRYFVFSIDPQLNRTSICDGVRRRRAVVGVCCGADRCRSNRYAGSPGESLWGSARAQARHHSPRRLVRQYHYPERRRRRGEDHRLRHRALDADRNHFHRCRLRRQIQDHVSPQQLGLYGGDVNARSDIYSLGLVLLEALQGEPADMGGTQVEVIEKRKSVPRLAAVDPRVRPIIEKMLQPDPDLRQQSMQAVADDFAQLPLEAPVARPREAPLAPPREAQTRIWPRVTSGSPAQGAARAGRGERSQVFDCSRGGGNARSDRACRRRLCVALRARKKAPPPEVVLQPPPEKPAVSTPPPGASSTGAAVIVDGDAPRVVNASAAGIVDAGVRHRNAGDRRRRPPLRLSPRASRRFRPRSALNFISQYAGGACFSIITAAATDFSAKIEGLGASQGHLRRA